MSPHDQPRTELNLHLQNILHTQPDTIEAEVAREALEYTSSEDFFTIYWRMAVSQAWLAA